MSESEIEGFINKVELGLVEAQHDMLSKRLYTIVLWSLVTEMVGL